VTYTSGLSLIDVGQNSPENIIVAVDIGYESDAVHCSGLYHQFSDNRDP
jgi:hypothetical protein